MSRNLILLEGETELHFYNEFKEWLKIPMERKKINVLTDKVKGKICGMKYDTVFFLFDIDVLKLKQVKKFSSRTTDISEAYKYARLIVIRFPIQVVAAQTFNEDIPGTQVFYDCFFKIHFSYQMQSGFFINNFNMRIFFQEGRSGPSFFAVNCFHAVKVAFKIAFFNEFGRS